MTPINSTAAGARPETRFPSELLRTAEDIPGPLRRVPRLNYQLNCCSLWDCIFSAFGFPEETEKERGREEGG